MKYKRLIFSLLLGAMCATVQAQTGLDTVFGRYPYYYYSWFDEEWMTGSTHDGTDCVCDIAWSHVYDADPDACQYNFLIPRYKVCETAIKIDAGSSLDILGFAIIRWDNAIPYYSQIHNAEMLQDVDCYFNIYDTNMNLIFSKAQKYGAIQEARYIPAGGRLEFDLYYLPKFRPVCDVFFDTVLTLQNPFYISVTMSYIDTALKPNITWTGEVHSFPCLLTYDSIHYRIPWETYRYRDTLYTGQWRDDYTFGWQRTNIFPIIQRPQDTCPQVRDIELFPSGAGHAFLRWGRGSNHQGWQVSYGPAGTAPDDGTLLDFSSPISSVIAFDPDSHYVAYVRARCHFARDEWGPWSDSVSIWLGAPNSVDAAALAGSITLAPNPASDEVVVDCPVPISAIEVFDARGACIMRNTQLNTKHYTLNTKHWPSSQYVVIIETPAGKIAKRMTVVR